jgi:methylated-DNA-protein-cysteine methyltransferase-like protein
VARSKALAEWLPGLKKTPAKAHSKDPRDNPLFQEIWNVVAAIPRGHVSTYGAVARAAGLPGRARLAGRALRESPKAMHLPWQRVVGAGGRIVFPRSALAHREQTRRLRAEGVIVKEGRVGREFMVNLE